MSYMEHNAAFAPAGGIQELSFDEIDLVEGGGVNWTAVGKFAGRAVGVGVRVGAWGLAGAAVATLVYVAIDAIDWVFIN